MAPRMASCKRDRTRAAAVWMVALALLLCCRMTPAASADFYTTASYPDLDVRVKQLVYDATAPPVDATQGECFVDERCGHGHGAFTRLCDPDHVLSYPGALRVSATLNLIETNITMSCGSAGQQPYQVAVALMNRAHMGYSEEASDVIPRLTRALHDKWGVGHAACNNGIVLGLSVQDRYAFISTGKGARPALRDEYAEHIIDRAKPLLRAGRLDDAVFQIVTDMHTVLQAGPGGETSISKAATPGFWEMYGSLIFFGLLAASVTGCSWYHGRHQRAERARVQELLTRMQVAYQPHAQGSAVRPPGQVGDVLLPDDGVPLASQMGVCPVCLEDFPRTGSTDGSNASTPTPDAPHAHDGGSAGGAGGATAAATAVPAASEDGAHSQSKVGAPSAVVDDPTVTAPDAEVHARTDASESTRLLDTPSNRDHGGVSAAAAGSEASATAPQPVIVQLRCRHRFHRTCIETWLADHGRTTCPMCRAPVMDDAPDADQGGRGTSQPPPAGRGADGLRHRATPSTYSGGASASAAMRTGSGSSTATEQDDAPSCGGSGAAAAAGAPPPHVPYMGGATYTRFWGPSRGWYIGRPYYHTYYNPSDDVYFMLNRLHTRYPNTYAATQVEQFMRDPRAFTRAEPSTFLTPIPRAPSSSRSSFGGGSSRGGGGGGGGW